MSQINTVTDADFQKDVLDSDIPVLVDFWADWCAPCKAIAPNLEQVAKEYEGKIKILKLNVDENPETPSQYGIRGIPTLIIFVGGEVKKTTSGMASKEQLMTFIDSAL